MFYLMPRFAALALAAFSLLPVAAADKPDILFIAIDDLNDWVGPLGGHPQAKTPNIDRLAKMGMTFTNAHATAPVCNPSRSSLMSGMLPSHIGVYGNRDDWRESPALEGKPVLPLFLQSNGYHTIGGGKLFHASTFRPEQFYGLLPRKGFDDYYPAINRQLPDEIRPLGWPINKNPGLVFGLFDWAPVVAEDAATGDGQVVSWAVKQLGSNHDKPLFLGAGIYRPHLPWYVPPAYFDMHPLDQIELPATNPNDLDDVPGAERNARDQAAHQWVLETDNWKQGVQAYLASISFADAMAGKLLDALEASGRADKTIVVLFSDHGWHLGEKGQWRKQSLWEESTRVPLIVVAPGVTTAGSRSAEPVSLLDLYPTLAELSGLDAPDHLQGHSLLPLLKKPDAEWPHVAVTTYNFNNHAVRTRHHRYIRYSDGGEELYDHREDPQEWHNLASSPDQDALKKRLAALLPKVNLKPLSPPGRRGGPGGAGRRGGPGPRGGRGGRR